MISFFLFINGLSALILLIDIILFCCRRLTPLRYLWSSGIVTALMVAIATIFGIGYARDFIDSVGKVISVIFCAIAEYALFLQIPLTSGFCFHFHCTGDIEVAVNSKIDILEFKLLSSSCCRVACIAALDLLASSQIR